VIRREIIGDEFNKHYMYLQDVSCTIAASWVDDIDDCARIVGKDTAERVCTALRAVDTTNSPLTIIQIKYTDDEEEFDEPTL
jgi:hypothetical protein